MRQIHEHIHTGTGITDVLKDRNKSAI